LKVYRELLLAAGAFAVALGAVSLAGVVAWARCGRGSDCTPDLALGIAGGGPAALLLIVVLLLVGREASSRSAAKAVFVAALVAAGVPLAAFVIRDVPTLVITLLLFGGLVALALLDDDGGEIRDRPPQPAGHGAGSDDAGMQQVDEQSQVVVSTVVSRKRISRRLTRRADAAAGLADDAHIHTVPGEPTTVVLLALVRTGDFEAFAALYEAVIATPRVIDVVVHSYDDVRGGFMDVRLRDRVAAEAVIDLFNHALSWTLNAPALDSRPPD
jgi:hypothetical protein